MPLLLQLHLKSILSARLKVKLQSQREYVFSRIKEKRQSEPVQGNENCDRSKSVDTN